MTKAHPPAFTIDGRAIGAGYPPYIIAELSGNHNGDIGRAFALIEAAAAAGADAVKLQTYTADTITIDHNGPEFVVDLPLWRGRTLHDLYREAHTPWDWHAALFDKARACGISLFSSPFDFTAVDFLEDLNCPAYKIASFEMVDTQLIAKAASTGKPMIISTGMASLEEIAQAIQAAREGGCRDLAILHCVSAYPAPYSDAFLANITDLKNRFDVHVGLSDHTPGITVPIAAATLGAVIIEKHVTLSRDDGGVDSQFSLEPDELRSLVDAAAIVPDLLGGPFYGVKESERDSVKYRRSLYVVADIRKGEPFTPDNVRSIRPGLGMAPSALPRILNKHAARDIGAGTPLTPEDIE
ncbi:MAG: pseudaminic acid synthase [Magnetovibrio sp.]|nr:pseudaminic acid synthase [Magnetovibrio sp.]|tara:strand:- start:258 stop:1319 length:1062 start_codon:yes stop_codon:yes gene_type:complete